MGLNKMGLGDMKLGETRIGKMRLSEMLPNQKMLTCVLFIKNTCNILCRNRMKTHSMHKMQ